MSIFGPDHHSIINIMIGNNNINSGKITLTLEIKCMIRIGYH